MVSRPLLSALFLFILASQIHATTWHISKAGNDSNDGKSWGTAFKTWHSGAVDSMSGGDTLLWGAGRWDTTRIDLTNALGGTYSVPTVFLDSLYEADGTVGGATISSAQHVTGWTLESGNIYTALWNPGSRFIYQAWSQSMTQNDKAMVPRYGRDSVVSGNGAATAGEGHFHHDGTTIWAWLWGDANPSNETMMITCEPTVTIVPGANDADHIRFIGLSLRMGQQGTIVFRSGADSVRFEHCNLYGPGGQLSGENPSVFMTRAIPNGDYTDYGEYNAVVGCSVSQGYPSAGIYPWFASVGVGHRGDGITLYTQHHFYVDSNVFFDLPGYATSFKVSQWLAQQNETLVTANVFRFNECIGRETVRNDTMFGSGGAIILLCGGLRDSVYGNTIRNMTDPGVMFYEGCESVGGHFIGNNSFYNCMVNFRIHHMIAGHRAPDTTSVIKYNYGTYRWVNSPSAGSEMTAGYWDVYSLAELAATHDIDYNGWYDTLTYRFGFNASYTWAQWQSIPHDANGKIANPNFIDPARGDFSRPDTSQEMDLFYGGRQWTLWGAWQPGDQQPVVCWPPGNILIAPLDGDTVAVNAQLEWQSVPAASQYQVQISANSAFSATLFDQLTTDTILAIPALAASTDYYWRVRAFDSLQVPNWSCWTAAWKFFVDCSIAPDPPPLFLPADADTNVAPSVNLQWSSVSTAVTYDLEFDDDPTFFTPLISVSLTDRNYMIDSLTAGATYYWRVRACNNCGCSNWSVQYSFTITNDTTQVTCQPLANDLLTAPLDGDSVAFPALLQWQAVASASQYHVQVANNPTFTAPQIDSLVPSSETTLTIPSFAADQTYYWRVRALDNQQNWSCWTSLSQFSVIDTVTISLAASFTILAGPSPVFFQRGETVWFYLPDNPVDLTIIVAGAARSRSIVLQKTGLSGSWQWDGKNDRGQQVASGIYLWYVNNRDDMQQGKIMVVR